MKYRSLQMTRSQFRNFESRSKCTRNTQRRFELKMSRAPLLTAAHHEDTRELSVALHPNAINFYR